MCKLKFYIYSLFFTYITIVSQYKMIFYSFFLFYYGFFLLHSYSPTMNLLFYFTPFPFPLFPLNPTIYAYAIYFRFIFTIVFAVVITVLVVVLVITISIYIIILSGLIPVLSCQYSETLLLYSLASFTHLCILCYQHTFAINDVLFFCISSCQNF